MNVSRFDGLRSGQREIVQTSFAVFLADGLTGAMLMFAGAPYLVSSVFHIDGTLQPDALTAFRLGAFILACSFISSLFSSLLRVFGRFDWLNGSAWHGLRWYRRRPPRASGGVQ